MILPLFRGTELGERVEIMKELGEKGPISAKDEIWGSGIEKPCAFWKRSNKTIAVPG